MNNQIIKYEELALITIKNPDTNTFVFRFIFWKNRELFEKQINEAKIFKIGDETFPVRNFEKLEKFTGEFPSPEVLQKIQEKIRKYRATFGENPNEKTLKQMQKNAKKEIENL